LHENKLRRCREELDEILHQLRGYERALNLGQTLVG